MENPSYIISLAKHILINFSDTNYHHLYLADFNDVELFLEPIYYNNNTHENFSKLFAKPLPILAICTTDTRDERISILGFKIGQLPLSWPSLPLMLISFDNDKNLYKISFNVGIDFIDFMFLLSIIRDKFDNLEISDIFECSRDKVTIKSQSYREEERYVFYFGWNNIFPPPYMKDRFDSDGWNEEILIKALKSVFKGNLKISDEILSNDIIFGVRNDKLKYFDDDFDD